MKKKFAENIRKDPKSFYSYVRSKSKCNDRVGPLKDVNGDIVTDDLDMCNILNNFFSSVFRCEDSTNVLPEVKQRYLGSLDGMLNDINIDREKVLNTLEKLQVNKAPG